MTKLEDDKDLAQKIVDTVREPMLVLDVDLRVHSANNSFYRNFQVEPGETVGRLVYDLGNGQWDIAALRELLENVLPHNHFFNDFEVQHDFENLGHRAMLLNARRVDHLQLILLAIEDVTERSRAEAQLKDLLQQKEVLLKEINHRVKNNLQAINNLLYVQASTIGEGPVRQIIRTAQDRIKAIAMVHEQIYHGENLTRVNLADYLSGLARQLIYLYRPDPNSLVLKLDVDEVELDVDTAVPMGVIVNELVSNALKHAFSAGRDRPGQPDEIEIKLRPAGEDRFLLTVRDNGVGLPEGLDPAQAPSLGLRLVEILIGQMQGELDIERNGGTAFKISFSRLKSE